MRLMFRTLSALVIVALGCGDSPSGPDDPGYPVWMPMNESEQWLYEASGYMVQEGDTLDASGLFIIDYKQEVMHSLGFPVVEIEEVDSTVFTPRKGGETLRGSRGWTFYRRLTDDMLRLYYNLEADSGMVELVLPLVVGDQWELCFPGLPGVTQVREVISLTDSVSVPFGDFTDCAHVRASDGLSLTGDFWYADSVGLVRWTVQEAGVDMMFERIPQPSVE